MTIDQLKPNKILRGPVFAEPVEIIVTVPMGATVKLVGRGLQTGKVVDNMLHDPSTLEWQPIVKVEHYWLRHDSVRHPVELKEDAGRYRTGGSS